MATKAWLCEKIPEKEFDRDPELNPGWVVAERKNGFVYIIYDHEEQVGWPQNAIKDPP